MPERILARARGGRVLHWWEFRGPDQWGRSEYDSFSPRCRRVGWTWRKRLHGPDPSDPDDTRPVCAECARRVEREEAR